MFHEHRTGWVGGEYIEVFYNRSRRHSTPGYNSPIRFLQTWISKQGAQQPLAA
jgi:hypothetical protein